MEFGKNTDDNNETWTIANGQAHGEYYHTLTINEMPSHNHTIDSNSHAHRLPTNLTDKVNPGTIDYFSGYGWGKGSYYNWSMSEPHTHGCQNTGKSWKHNNMPPYLGVYMWKRTK